MIDIGVGAEIELKDGMQYEIIVAYPGGYYDLKAMKPQFEWMPNFFPVYYSIRLNEFKIINQK
jgi:hypothetical protein